MKQLIFSISVVLFLSGCASYTTVAPVGKGAVALTKNDSFLGGLWPGPKVYVCKVTTGGLSNCKTQENP